MNWESSPSTKNSVFRIPLYSCEKLPKGKMIQVMLIEPGDDSTNNLRSHLRGFSANWFQEKQCFLLESNRTFVRSSCATDLRLSVGLRFKVFNERCKHIDSQEASCLI